MRKNENGMGLDHSNVPWDGLIHADVLMVGVIMRPKIAPHCEYCGRIIWGRACNCDKTPSIKKKLTGWFDVNSDGELTVEDLSIMAIGHHWMLLGGLFIFIGAVGNVMGWWTINSDAFWAAAGLAAIMEYRDDVKRGRRK